MNRVKEKVVYGRELEKFHIETIDKIEICFNIYIYIYIYIYMYVCMCVCECVCVCVCKG